MAKISRMSDLGALSLLAREAITLVSYKDTAGVWTIGVGHTAAAGGLKPGPGVTLPSIEAALALYLVDLAKYEADVAAMVKVPLAQHQFDALVSWHYNTGAVRKASFIPRLNACKTPAEIASVGAAGLNQWKANKELIPRRDGEIAQFLGGTQPSVRAVGVWEKTYPKGRVNKTLGVSDIAAARASLAGVRPDLAPIVLPAGPTTLPPAPPLVVPPPSDVPAPEPQAGGSWLSRLADRWRAAYGKREG